MGLTYEEILGRNPIVGAPLADVSDYPFRRIQRIFSDGLIHTEMVASMGIIYDNEKTWEMCRTVEHEVSPVGIQIMGSDATVVGKTVAKIARLSPAIIDINMACPVRKIVKSDCGAALLEDAGRAAEIVRAAKSETEIPIGVKIRLGLARVNVHEIADALVNAGVNALTIHGRTAEQLYRGESSRAPILEVAKRIPIPVIASGDVFSSEDVNELLAGGARGVLVARGMIGKPWFLSEAKAAAIGTNPPPLPDRREIVLRHLGYIVEFYGEDGVRKFRRHLVEYVHGLPGAPALRHALVTAKSSGEVAEIIRGLPEAA